LIYSVYSVVRLFYLDLPATYRDHDFQLVVGHQFHARILAARHDFAIALNGDTLSGELHLFQQLRQVDVLWDLACCAIDRELNQNLTR
jgi:hypothetical protein